MNVVYSSEKGAMCPKCNSPVSDCICRKKQFSHSSDGIVKIRREMKGRKGKGVIAITDIPEDLATVKELARELKTKLSCGGTIKNDRVEIQGDRVEDVLSFFKSKGYRVKKVGG